MDWPQWWGISSLPIWPHTRSYKFFLFFVFCLVFLLKMSTFFYKWLVSGTIIRGTPTLCDGGCFQPSGDMQEQISHIFTNHSPHPHPLTLSSVVTHTVHTKLCAVFFYYAIHSIFYYIEQTYSMSHLFFKSLIKCLLSVDAMNSAAEATILLYWFHTFSISFFPCLCFAKEKLLPSLFFSHVRGTAHNRFWTF
jgi:hypothetical protein